MASRLARFRLPRAVRRRLRPLRIVTPEYLRLLADWSSRRTLLHLHYDPASLGRGPVELRLRALDPAILVRPGSSDLWVVHDAFTRGYHLPPSGLLPAAKPLLILDLGANIGLTAADLAAHFPQARVVGVELDEDNVALARQNVRPWADRCTILHGGVWSESGELTYASELGKEQSNRLTAVGGGTGRLRHASAITLDGLLNAIGDPQRVDYVKMDIEGAERVVLTANTAWAQRVAVMKVEVHAPYTVTECTRDLTILGFRTEPDAQHTACVVAIRDDGPSDICPGVEAPVHQVGEAGRL